MRSISLLCLLLTTVAVSGQDLQLRLVKTFVGHEHGVNRVVFSPDGSRFASGDTRGGIRVWDLGSESVTYAWNEHYGAILDLQFSNDGKLLVSSGSDGQLRVWDLYSGNLVQRIKSPVDPSGAPNQVRFGKFSNSGEQVYFGGSNKYVCQKDIGSEDNGKVIHFENTDIKCGAVSPDGSRLTVGVGKMLVSIDLSTGKPINEFNTGDCGINSVRYSKDGGKLLCWCSNSRVDVRDPETLILQTSFRSGTGARRFSDLFFMADQKHIITGDHASRFNIWDLQNRKLILDQSTEQGTVMAFDMKQESDLLLSGSLDKTIKLWKITKAPEVQEKRNRKKKNEEPEAELIVIENASMVREQETEEMPLAVVKNDLPKLEQSSGPSEEPAPVTVNVVQEIEMVEPTVTDSILPDTMAAEVEEVPEPAAQIGNFEKLPEKLNGRRVLPVRKEHRLSLSGHKVVLKVWDDQVVDGDIISLYVNDREVLANYSIVEKQHTVEFDAAGMDKCYVFLHAHNLGKIPPNTVTMTVSDGTNLHRIQLRSDLKGSASVELKFN